MLLMTNQSIHSNTFLGISLVLLGAVGLAAQNVILRLYFTPSVLFGQLNFGGLVTPLIGNIVLLLALRMAMMSILLTIMARRFYPNTFVALRELPQVLPLLGCVIGSGLCLFFGLTLLYFALSQVAVGIAIATFFIYPAITVLLAWRFFRQRPRAYQLWLMMVIFIGVVLTTLTPIANTASNPVLGSLSALGAGLSFGLYGILAEISLQAQPTQPALHPVPFSLLTFGVVASLASLSALILHQIDQGQIAIAPAVWLPVFAMTLFSAALTLLAYVLNNFGIRYIGASLTAIISASTPVLTTLFAWWILQEALQRQQIVGIGLVTIGVAALSLKAERLN